MKEKLVGTAIFFAVILIGSAVMFSNSDRYVDWEERNGEHIIMANEIKMLIRSGNTDLAAEKLTELQQSLTETDTELQKDNGTVIMCMLSLAFMMCVFIYVYAAILRPFERMKYFADSIAKGDLDLPLDQERSNYFGTFTWAFDHMRREIIKARSCEREAIENNKTVIATLSHDIKTPIASIRAYAEGLEACLDSSPEKRAAYLTVIMRKCDEVSKLTNDLFLHSLSDLDKLKIAVEQFELCEWMEAVLSELSAEQNDVRFVKPDFTAAVLADQNRLMQITENLINNARKYAKTGIDVSVIQTDGSVEVHFRDYGEGIPDEDMPFIFDKFYRGRNCGNEQGSGLGLYIVKYIMEQMDGTVMLHNHADGLEAVISLPVKK